MWWTARPQRREVHIRRALVWVILGLGLTLVAQRAWVWGEVEYPVPQRVPLTLDAQGDPQRLSAEEWGYTHVQRADIQGRAYVVYVLQHVRDGRLAMVVYDAARGETATMPAVFYVIYDPTGVEVREWAGDPGWASPPPKEGV